MKELWLFKFKIDLSHFRYLILTICYIFIDEVTWSKETINGDDQPVPRSQHVALPCLNNTRVWVFGGHHDPKTRLNDTWFFNIKEMEWRRVGNEKNNLENQASTIGAPSPRANTGAIILNDKVYLFGGHGGLNYSRVALNDLYSFDLKEEVWEKLVPANTGPEGRGGHSVFAAGDKIYIYGGWNNEMQYNNIWFYDLTTNEWTDPDIYNGTPRWNHSSVLVPAIPTWKFFIFGGE